MKKVLFTTPIALVWFFVSCSSPSSSTPSTPVADSTSQAEKNTANDKAVWKGIETGDMSVMDSIVADDVVDHSGMMGEIKGRDSVKKMLSDIHNHITNIKFESIAAATEGDYHFALTRLTGTTKDATMGMPANTPVDRISVGVVRLVNGKIKDHWMYVDSKEMMQMMEKMRPAGKKSK